MKVKVIEGYVSFSGYLFAKGEVIDAPADVAKHLLSTGVVVTVEGARATKKANDEVPESPAEDPEESMELPDANPETVVETGKKGNEGSKK